MNIVHDGSPFYLEEITLKEKLSSFHPEARYSEAKAKLILLKNQMGEAIAYIHYVEQNGTIFLYQLGNEAKNILAENGFDKRIIQNVACYIDESLRGSGLFTKMMYEVIKEKLDQDYSFTEIKFVEADNPQGYERMMENVNAMLEMEGREKSFGGYSVFDDEGGAESGASAAFRLR